jgi:hypothetical protein
MVQRLPIYALKEIPLERIFRKITGRKMTKEERICFHLKPLEKHIVPKPV